MSWYTQGGFTDELGRRHDSGYRFKIPYWEVFNEIDIEHQPSPEQYTASYGSVVGALHAIDPEMKFVGLALAFPERHPEMIEYFLDHAHHKPGIPLDMISYHFYATPTRAQTAADWQYNFFDQADRVIASIRFVEAIRKRLSPETRTTIDEIGSILPTDWHPDKPYDPGPAIAPEYWNASGAMFAYFFIETAKLGIDVVGESQLVGFPLQYPSVTMVDWTTGKTNARFEVLRLLHDRTQTDDQVTKVKFIGTDIDAMALEGPTGKRLLLVNKRNRPVSVQLPEGFAKGSIVTVDESIGNARPATREWRGATLMLAPFAVAMITARQV